MTHREKMCFLLGINYAARYARNLGHKEIASDLISEQVSLDQEYLTCSALLSEAPEDAYKVQQELVEEFKLNSPEVNPGDREEF